MFNLKISAITLILLIILLYLHLIGMYEHLYGTYWFYDIILHLLGGIGIAMSIYCIITFFNLNYIKNRLWIIIILTFIAGFAWEIFELYFDIAGAPFGTLDYKIDTIKDLFNDTLGSIIVLFFINFNNKMKKIKKSLEKIEIS